MTLSHDLFILRYNPQFCLRLTKRHKSFTVGCQKFPQLAAISGGIPGCAAWFIAHRSQPGPPGSAGQPRPSPVR
jgi:hypothetical protein